MLHMYAHTYCLLHRHAILQVVLRRGRDCLQRAWGACSILVVNTLTLGFRHLTLELSVTMMHPVCSYTMVP
jgi:hypothetical protein